MTTKIQCNVLTPDLPSIQTHYKIKKFISARFDRLRANYAIGNRVEDFSSLRDILDDMSDIPGSFRNTLSTKWL